MTTALPFAAPRLDLAALPRNQVPGLYVHVPFCFHKCHYCDFYSITRQTDERMSAFVDRLLAEADLWHDRSASIQPRTVFFGGGTPSLLPLPHMLRLLSGLKQRFDLSAVDEWTLEVNPATANPDYCHMLRQHGVNRLSFGGQSFDRAELATLERRHDPDDVPRSVEIARAAGFARINIDLIFAIPGQSMASWLRSLEATVALRTPHISCYALTYEPNTPMAVKKRMGLLQPAEESLELAMLRETRSRLRRQDLHPYEVSNFAVPGEACRHNLLYWDGGSYIGLGPSASSHVHGTRWKNRPHLGEWERAIDSGELPAAEVESLSVGQRMGEHAMLRLRLADGLEFGPFLDRWKVDARELFADPIDRYSATGLLDVDDRRVCVTEAGVAVADAIASAFLAAAID